MLFVDVAETSREVAGSAARSAKTVALARLFAKADPDDAPIVITYLAGRLPQRRIGVGWRALSSLRQAPAPVATLTVRSVDEALGRIAAVSGKGSTAERQRLLGELMAAATGTEQDFLFRLLSGELRQGALDALAVEGLAAAAGAEPEEVRRAVMLGGSLGAVARELLAHGVEVLGAFRLQVGRPVQPMLAQSAKSVDEALDRVGPCAVEEKLDGIRVQVHRDGERVRVYTRTLAEIGMGAPPRRPGAWGSLAEVRAAALELDVRQAVLDGEVIALGPDGRPRPFQETAGRVGTLPRPLADEAAGPLPLFPVFFDLLYVDGRELLGLPAGERHAELARVVPEHRRVRRLVVREPADEGQREAARAFADDVLDRGHEGVLVKGLDSAYGAGRRGASWLKVKPVHTLDLVVLAAEWGHGRRAGKLSNLHLGARRADGTFGMLGKTFKGLTDAMLDWQTERLTGLALDGDVGGGDDGGGDRGGEEGWVVRVRPELVVEVAFDGVQRSTRYPEGVTLRFARVLRYREDKPAAEADTVESVRALLR
ncbi:ATP-dependent DNA ligase [Streptomyces sp. B6B3]|uniref:ATP-dependent DNA ligase n=1 Tax=Streptomyces sp. B6B3 TaxID=3153570 RepID=UPI00325F0CE2